MKWEDELAGWEEDGWGNWHRKGKDNLFNSWASVVKCAIILPSATTNGPFSFSSACPLLSFLFVLSCASSNVSDCINFSPSSLLSNLSSSTTAPTLHHPFLLCSPSPLLSLLLYPQLISSSYLICCSLWFNFLTLPALKCTHVPVLFP